MYYYSVIRFDNEAGKVFFIVCALKPAFAEAREQSQFGNEILPTFNFYPTVKIPLFFGYFKNFLARQIPLIRSKPAYKKCNKVPIMLVKTKPAICQNAIFLFILSPYLFICKKLNYMLYKILSGGIIGVV